MEQVITQQSGTEIRLKIQEYGKVCLAVLIFFIGFEIIVIAQSSTRATPGQDVNARPPACGIAPIKLVQGRASTVELAPGQKCLLEFEVPENSYVHVEAKQQGVDVILTLKPPQGLEVSRDWPNSEWGPEMISFVAPVAAGGSVPYRLEVVGQGTGTDPGRVSILLITKPRPTNEDREQIRAEDAYAAGLREFDDWRRRKQGATREGAIKNYEEAARIWRGINFAYGVATADTSIAFALGPRADQQRLLELYGEARAMFHSVGDVRREAQLLNNLGQLSEVRGQLTEAFKSYKAALDLWRSPGAPPEPLGVGTALNNMGTIQNELGEQQEAIDLLTEAITLFQKAKNPILMAKAMNNLGLVYMDLGEYGEARRDFDAAQSIRQELISRKQNYDPEGYSTTLHNLGLLFAFQGDNTAALDSLNKALRIRERLGDQRLLAYTLYGIGFVSAMKGDHTAALKVYRDVLPYHVGDAARQAVTHASIGNVLYSLGRAGEALAEYKEAYTKSMEQSNKSIEALALFGLGRSERDSGNLDSAAAHLDQAMKIIEGQRVKIIDLDWRATYFASVRKIYELYADVLMRLDELRPGLGFRTTALEINDRGRARSLIDLLNEGPVDISVGNDPSLLANYYELQRQLNRAERLRLSLESRGGAAPDKKRATDDVEAILLKMRKVDAQIKRQNKSYAFLSMPQVLDLAGMQKLLDPETLLIEFSLGEECSYLWLTSKEGRPYVVKLPPRRTIESAVRPLLESIREHELDPPGETVKVRTARLEAADQKYRVAAEALADILFGQVLNQLGAKRLLIVSDGILQYVPFPALPIPATASVKERFAVERAPLIVEHTVVSLPSASALSTIRELIGKRRPAPKMLAVLADPVYERSDSRFDSPGKGTRKDRMSLRLTEKEARSRERGLTEAARDLGLAGPIFPRLPLSGKEADAILALVNESDKMRAVGFDANYRTATDPVLRQYRYIHFATHGVLDSKHPELSGIVLSLFNDNGVPTPEGFLRLHDIYNLKLPAELIVLSGCRTALGEDVAGEGLIGITRGFMHAGARRVIASLWKADDESTKKLMERFYQEMIDRNTAPADALRIAQTQMWAENRERSPYYWAAFVLQGEWQ